MKNQKQIQIRLSESGYQALIAELKFSKGQSLQRISNANALNDSTMVEFWTKELAAQEALIADIEAQL